MIQVNDESKKVLLDEIKAFFKRERDEELSDFQAENYLFFILNTAGVYIYNQAVSDVHTFMSEKVDELFVLEKRKDCKKTVL